MKEEFVYSVWLYMVNGIGEKTCLFLVKFFGSAKNVYDAALHGSMEMMPGEIQKKMPIRKWQEIVKDARQSASETGLNPIREKIAEWSKQGIHIAVYGQEGYPRRLGTIPDPPFILFYKGDLPSENVPSVAIVGARECSAYGEFVAQELGKSLGKAGIQVISGMARGIDGISQRASLEEGGKSFGVLGCGVDICYPKTNQNLYDHLCEKGGVISAYLPGTVPTPSGFPPRNRIVSGLADALVVVEARAKSGTLITVDMALEQGKDVFVVPGRITDRLSDGCNRLLALGASPVLTPMELIKHLNEICLNMGMRRKEKGIDVLESVSKIHSNTGANLKINENLDTGANLDVDADLDTSAGSCTNTEMNIWADLDTNIDSGTWDDQPHKADQESNESLSDQIYALLEQTPISTFQIMESLKKRINADFGEVTMELMKLCSKGRVKQISPGQFVKEK